MTKTRVVATGTAAFGVKWELGVDEDGYWAIAREIGPNRGHFVRGLGISVQYFDNETDAREHFVRHTTPIVAQGY